MARKISVIGAAWLVLVGCGNVRSDVGAMYAGSGGGPVSVAGANGRNPHQSSGGEPQGGAPGQGDGTAAGAGDTEGGEEEGTGGSSLGAPVGLNLDGAPLYTRVQRLTRSQWENSARDILRLETTPTLDAPTPPILYPEVDFSNNERALSVDVLTATALEVAAEAAAGLATASDQELALLHPTEDRDEFVRTLGRRAFRRPLTEAEEARYQAIFARGEELYGAGFANGAALVIRALLQSPLFLYRSELGSAGEPLSGYEVASKLSFWLLDTTPSDALLDLAAAGGLDDPDDVEAVARDMMETPAGRAAMRRFHGELYELAAYATIEKDGLSGWSPALRSELSEASEAFFDAVFERAEGLNSILTSPRGFVGPNLAPFYDMRAPEELEERELGQDRIGHFLQVPFLTRWGHDEQPRTISRGSAVWRQVLCPTVAPPHAVELPPPPVFEGETNRESVHELTGMCGVTCHNTYLNPLGFAFESYDGMGRRREVDNGKPVDSSGSLPLSGDTVDFTNARELLETLASSRHAHLCYSKKLASFALQRDIVTPDLPLLETLAAQSRMHGIKEQVVALVRHPAFRLRQQGSP